MSFALAVDIGATKAALATIDRDFQILARAEVPTGSTPNSWQLIEAATREILAKTAGNLIGVGIGSAGPLNLAQGTISPVNIFGWREFPIVKNFQELTHNGNVVLHGDAMALADAEHQLGAGRGVRNMLGMVVSTGIGGGLIIDNQLVLGDTGNVSFFGHHSINHTGIACVCGRIGCVEAYASGPSMVKRAHQLGWSAELNTFIDLAEAARGGDTHALTAIDEGAHALAVSIVNVCAINDIKVVVVGGGVCESGDIYWRPLQKYVESESKHISFLDGLQLRKAELVRDAGLMGAALGVISRQ